MKRKIIAVWFLILVSCVMAGCVSKKRPGELRKVTLQLNWRHEVEFVGYYVAKAKGFYAEAGLEVEITETPSGSLTSESIQNSKAEFLVLDESELTYIKKQSTEPRVVLTAIYQTSPHVFIVRSDSGIITPRDFVGRTVGIKSGGWEITFDTVMRGVHVDPGTVRKVPVSSDMTPFHDGKVDIWTGYIFSEPIMLKLKGYNIKTFLANDYGFQSYSGLLTVSESVLKENPALVNKFVKATLKGWQYAIQHPDEAADIILSFAPDLDRAFQIQAIHALIPLIHTGEQSLGWIDEEKFQMGLKQLGAEIDKLNLKIDREFVSGEF